MPEHRYPLLFKHRLVQEIEVHDVGHTITINGHVVERDALLTIKRALDRFLLLPTPQREGFTFHIKGKGRPDELFMLNHGMALAFAAMLDKWLAKYPAAPA